MIQPAPSQRKDFGQPVVSDQGRPLAEGEHQDPLTPAQAAARFHVPEYLLRKACGEGRLEHFRVVNTLWLTPTALAAFAASWRAALDGIEHVIIGAGEWKAGRAREP